MIGLCGTHRTGKTTLARAFSSRYEIPFAETSTSKVFADNGLDPSKTYPFATRLDIQRKVLDAAVEAYTATGERVFITDRTPLDMLAYTLADIGQGNLTSAEEVQFERYMRECISVTNRFFALLIVVPIALPVMPAPGKASLSLGYREHHSTLVTGLAISDGITATNFRIPRTTIDLDRRVECVRQAFTRTNLRHEESLSRAKEAGEPVVFH